jgi:hypothetical protein
MTKSLIIRKTLLPILFSVTGDATGRPFTEQNKTVICSTAQKTTVDLTLQGTVAWQTLHEGTV